MGRPLRHLLVGRRRGLNAPRLHKMANGTTTVAGDRDPVVPGSAVSGNPSALTANWSKRCVP